MSFRLQAGSNSIRPPEQQPFASRANRGDLERQGRPRTTEARPEAGLPPLQRSTCRRNNRVKVTHRICNREINQSTIGLRLILVLILAAMISTQFSCRPEKAAKQELWLNRSAIARSKRMPKRWALEPAFFL